MKKLFLILMLVVAGSLLSCPKWQQDFKHFNSDMVGLKRTVTLYNVNGQPIKQWEGRFRIEHVPGGGISFISKGKVVIISGTFIVEEE